MTHKPAFEMDFVAWIKPWSNHRTKLDPTLLDETYKLAGTKFENMELRYGNQVSLKYGVNKINTR